MNISSFNISLNEVQEVLKEFKLFRLKGNKSINTEGVSKSFKEASQKDNYLNAYLEGLKNNDFDFLLQDQSYFQFQFSKSGSFYDIRYSFFQNPINYITYPEYVQQQLEEFGLTEDLGSLDSFLFEEYEQYLGEQDYKANYTTIRYDADYNFYRPLIHSVSHLHIGHNNHVRIPINKTITPLKFVLFTIKHVYYNQWHDKIDTNQTLILNKLKISQNGEIELDKDKWDLIENLEIHLK